jgi:hypothetical protein
MTAPNLKRRDGEYAKGPSRPISLRLNRALWEDWADWCKRKGWTPSAAIKALMEQVLAGAKSRGWRSKRATRALRSKDAYPLGGLDVEVSEVTPDDLFTHQRRGLNKMKGKQNG